MKEVVKKLLHEPVYRKVLHLIYSEKVSSPEQISSQLDLPEESLNRVLSELQDSGIIEIRDEGIRKKLEDFMLIMDFKTGSIYAVISERKAKEIREIIESVLNAKAPETNE